MVTVLQHCLFRYHVMCDKVSFAALCVSVFKRQTPMDSTLIKLSHVKESFLGI